MRLHRRLARLEKLVRGRYSDSSSLAAEAARWETIIIGLLELVPDSAYPALLELLEREWSKILWAFDRPRAGEFHGRFFPERYAVQVHLMRLLAMNPEEVREPIVRRLAGRSVPLSNWLLHLARKQSRLPPDLSANVMQQLITIYLDDSARIDTYSISCAACGLEWPDPKEKGSTFFANCPACRCGEWDWSHRSREQARPWHELLLADEQLWQSAARRAGKSKQARSRP